MRKKELRDIYKQKRFDLTKKQIADYQNNVYKQVFNLNLDQAKNVHIFLSLNRFKELDTAPIITFLRSKKKTLS